MEDKIMKKLFTLILAILCLLTMLSIPVFAADAGVEPYGTPGSGYDQKTFVYNQKTFTAYFYLQFDSSYHARSKCVTEAIVEVSHGTLTVQFTTGGSGYQTRTGGSKYYSAFQRSGNVENRTTYSNSVSYSSAFDVATGVNYMGGNATFNGYSGVKTSATLGFQK